jgi:transposase
MLAALRGAHLRHELGKGPIGVVLDSSGSHRSSEVRWPVGMHPLYLPAYSPELKQAEQVFRHIRKHLSMPCSRRSMSYKTCSLTNSSCSGSIPRCCSNSPAIPGGSKPSILTSHPSPERV